MATTFLSFLSTVTYQNDAFGQNSGTSPTSPDWVQILLSGIAAAIFSAGISADYRTNRLRFEPNEKGYAEQRDICVIPSCVLFEAIINRLSTAKKDRKHMENMIASSKGVLNNLI